MKTRILFVNGNLAVGGVERALVNMLAGLDPKRYDVDLLLLQSGNDYLNEIPAKVNIIHRETEKAFGPLIPTVMGAMKHRDYFSLGFRLCMEMRYSMHRPLKKILGVRGCYDVAISFRPGLCEDIVLNVVSATKKFTWWHHGDFNIPISRDKLISNWSRFDKIITVSQGIAAQIKSLSELFLDKVSIIPNIIDIENIRAKAGGMSPYTTSDTFKIITVSRLSEEKNIPLIIDIAKELKNRNISFEWNIIGDGDMRTYIEREIVQAGLQNDVILRGQKDNPYPWIKYADVMMHPSTIESFGIVLLEAMALGIPCISTKSVGAVDLMNGTNGMIVDSDYVKIADCITRLRSNRTLMDACIQNGLKTSSEYTPNNVVKLFNNLIN